MQSMGMNAYLYAPKDDVKHRLSWREPYTEKEAENMRSLISAATDHNICFIFAISPGSDIVYSDDADAKALQSRLEQAVSLGCNAFALLFDDIDTRLSPPDQDTFGSPARAQVALTNKVYEALGRPEVFLFCPTEYCASRALPNVQNSSYLATLGSDLMEANGIIPKTASQHLLKLRHKAGINVMWTGPLVVSKRISTLGIRDLARLLKRPVVLWDNLHANDYDQRRVFLGPYAGRPLALRRRRLLRGVLTNPNCEFEANYVAIHTLAQWARIGHPTHSEKVKVSADLADTSEELEREEKDEEAQAEEEGDGGGGPGSSSSLPVYRPREALHNALRDWLALMLQDQRSNSALAKQSLSTRSSPTPMETDSTDTSETLMQVESDEVVSARTDSDYNTVSGFFSGGVVPSLGISLDDLHLLSDLFYLPFSHGPTALKALELGYWLRDNCHLAPVDKSPGAELSPWSKKFSELLRIITNVSQLREKIQQLPHPGVVYDLAPYLTDITSVFAMLLDYFRWLESGVMANRSQAHLKRLLTWFSPGYSEMTMSGDHEPWMFRGGLITELQRILPLESAQDLFPAPSRVGPTMTTTPAGQPIESVDEFSSQMPLTAPDSSKTLSTFQPRRPYLLRPYRPEDKPKIYALWSRILMHRLGLPQNALPEKYKDLPGDRYCLVYLERFPQHCLVVEGPPLYFDLVTTAETSAECGSSASNSSWDIVGFAFAAPDIVILTRVRDDLRREVLRTKYPKDKTLQSEENGMQERPPSILRKPSVTNSALLQLSVEDFIRMSLDWIHDERITRASSSIIAEVAATEAPPPEPLGAAISEQQQKQSQQQQRQLQPMAVEGDIEGESKPEKPADEKTEDEEPNSKTEGVEIDVEHVENEGEKAKDGKEMESSTVAINATSVSKPDEGQKKMEEVEETMKSGARAVEAIHSAMMAHPASIFVEMDDCSFCGSGTPLSGSLTMASGVMMNYHMGVGCDPPELVLDEVARRLFVCLLAGLKTCASHGVHVELDTINEPRAELYRRFGFYPVPAASTDFVTVLGRLI
ncbi:hypothetical protein Aperf_G00000099991 [Anoplocephala perfoliata]